MLSRSSKSIELLKYLKCVFLSVWPILLPIFSYYSMNEPELGAGIDPGMAFKSFPSSIWIRQDLNPQPLTTFRS